MKLKSKDNYLYLEIFNKKINSLDQNIKINSCVIANQIITIDSTSKIILMIN